MLAESWILSKGEDEEGLSLWWVWERLAAGLASTLVSKTRLAPPPSLSPQSATAVLLSQLPSHLLPYLATYTDLSQLFSILLSFDECRSQLRERTFIRELCTLLSRKGQATSGRMVLILLKFLSLLFLFSVWQIIQRKWEKPKRDDLVLPPSTCISCLVKRVSFSGNCLVKNEFQFYQNISFQKTVSYLVIELVHSYSLPDFDSLGHGKPPILWEDVVGPSEEKWGGRKGGGGWGARWKIIAAHFHLLSGIILLPVRCSGMQTHADFTDG